MGADFKATSAELPALGAPSDAEAIISAVRELGETEELAILEATAEGTPLVVVPKGKQVFDLKPYLDKFRPFPERKVGTALLTTLDAFIAHANRFKDAESAIFLDDEKDIPGPRFISVFDYHEKAGGRARHGQHRGIYAFPLSAEWCAWTKGAGVEMAQGDFAVFLEDRIPDVLAPASVGEKTRAFAEAAGIQVAAPARLLELSRGLSIKVDTQVAQHVNLSTGESQILFKEEHSSGDAASSLKVPSGFAIQIPVVRGGPAYQIPVRLRYRVSGGRVLWKYALYRTDLIFEEMLSEALEQVAAETALPLFRGRPE